MICEVSDGFVDSRWQALTRLIIPHLNPTTISHCHLTPSKLVNQSQRTIHSPSSCELPSWALSHVSFLLELWVIWASFLSFESCELPEESLKTDSRLVSTFTFCQNGKNTAPMPPWYQGIQRQFEFLAVLWALKTCMYFRKSHLSNGLRKLFWWRSYTTGSLEALTWSRALTSSWSHFVVVRFYNPFYSPFPPVLIFRILWAGLERRKCYRRSVMADW